MDFVYPLPQNKLHSRYDKLFYALKQGQTHILTGLPYSSRSAFLKFICQNDPQFLNEFIDSNLYKFLFIENPKSFSEILNQISNFLDLDYTSSDPYNLILKIINKFPIDKHKFKFVFVFCDAEKLFLNFPELSEFVSKLWHINHNPPNCQFNLVFTASPIFKEIIASKIFDPIRPALLESWSEFNLFDKEELNYTKLRLENFRNSHISDSVHLLASKYSGGHYLLYKQLSMLSESELNSESIIINSPGLENILYDIKKSTGNPQIPLLKNCSKLIEDLTPNERILFDFFSKQINSLVSRDEIAKCIWGDKWQNKYSDWAIDKNLSLLRRKIKTSGYKLSAIRNRGYQLCQTI